MVATRIPVGVIGKINFRARTLVIEHPVFLDQHWYPRHYHDRHPKKKPYERIEAKEKYLMWHMSI